MKFLDPWLLHLIKETILNQNFYESFKHQFPDFHSPTTCDVWATILTFLYKPRPDWRKLHNPASSSVEFLPHAPWASPLPHLPLLLGKFLEQQEQFRHQERRCGKIKSHRNLSNRGHRGRTFDISGRGVGAESVGGWCIQGFVKIHVIIYFEANMWFHSQHFCIDNSCNFWTLNKSD